MTRSAGRFAVRPRTVVIAMLVIVAASAAAVWFTLPKGSKPKPVTLEGFAEDSTATVSLAGMFPADSTARLRNPIGIDRIGQTLYVAESDAGVIRMFDLEGGDAGTIGLPSLEGTAAPYPTMLVASGQERIAVVDNTSRRVIVIDGKAAKTATVLLTLGGENARPVQPTAIAFARGEYYVFDAGTSTVKVFEPSGAPARELGAGLEPKLAYCSGLAVVDGALYVADSNAGRVVILDATTGQQIGILPERFSLPRAIKPMAEDQLAVVDTFDQAVYVVGGSGQLVDAIDAQSVPKGRLSSPRDAAWWPDNSRLYVTDASTGTIVVFNIRARN